MANPEMKLLPDHFPEGARYILESRDGVIHRWVELPDGQCVALPPRGAIVPLEQEAA
jgi:hypothetical protein